MLKNLMLRPILVSALFFAYAREGVCDDLVTTYESLFNDHVEITVPGYQGGTNPVEDFPLLVKLSENSPEGFHYSRVDKLGQDIRFLYMSKDSVTSSVPYEVDTWNTNGVSTLWVRLPYLNNNENIKLTMYWAPDDPDALPTNLPRTVWNGYAGVWHLNGSAAESTTNAIASTAGAKAAAQTGVIGSALGTRDSGVNGQILSIPTGTPVDSLTEGAYTVSAWLRVNATDGAPWLYSARTTPEDDAFGVALVQSSGQLKLKLHANALTNDTSTKTFNAGEWVHVAVVHKGATGKHVVYLNGAEFYAPTNDRTDKAGAGGLSFGGLVGAGAAGTLNGDLDDVRIYPAALAQRWCTNEYAQAVSSSYVSFGTVSSTGVPVYDDEEDPEPGDDPSPGPTVDASPADYAGTSTIIPDGIEAGVVLTNFVTMIKVWENSPAGFKPKDLPFGTDDLRFFDNEGNVLQYEVDTWDVNGESFFWVKLPRLTHSTIITMCWGLKAGRTLPEIDPTSVWTGYAGVWHLSDETDSTTNRATAVFGTNAVLSGFGQIGKAAGTMVSGQKGAILDIDANEAIDSLASGTFTASGWISLNKTTTRYGALFSRATATSPGWGAQFCGGTTGDSSQLAVQSGSQSLTNAVELGTGSWKRFDCVFAPDRLALYINGNLVRESALSGSILSGTGGKLSIGGFVSATEGVLGVNTLNGYIDEFRLRPGTWSETEREADHAQCSDEDFYTLNPVSWDETAGLQNRWKVEPTASKTEWDEGEEPAVFTNGEPWYGESVMSICDRTTGEVLAEMPTVAGDYRAVFTVAAVDRFSAMVYTIDFRIRMHRPTHDLGDENDRVLILNNDSSSAVSGGEVYAQSYSDSVLFPGRPYWVHDDDSGFDYTSVSLYYNFCGGLRHTYYARGTGETRKRLWDLIDVRYGNTYNNAYQVFEETGDWEEWDEGLMPEMNYLPWNPEGGTLVDEFGLTAGGWHEYAAQAVLCNTLQASVNSTLYTNGIGTIYFDCVNSHTDDATNGCYRLVVEMATNALTKTEIPVPSPALPTDDAIAATHQEWSEAEGKYVTVVHEPYRFADWKRLEMNVRLVNGTEMADLGTTNELTLALTGGGSYTNFYRVYVPVNFLGAARFRIIRTSVNTNYTVATDVHSMILVDNVICSAPADHVSIEPRGFYDTTKIMRETAGYEGAFKPSYPSIGDSAVYARAQVLSSSGEKVSGYLSSVRMHYRWRYLDQQVTDWMTVDLEPTTLISTTPISWPYISGDLEYWYDAAVEGEFYQYADYSGLGLGLPGYSEEVTSASGRAPTYDETTGRGDWFTRIRDGKSTCGTIKLYVRRGDSAPVEEVEMFVARDQTWRGCLLATNAVSDGILFRFEERNRQDDEQEDFQFNTNLWYYAETVSALPVSGSVVTGTTNDWGRIPWDGATGHVMFQYDESSRALTVVHADWQDFNGWNDAHNDYFVGTSTDDVTKRGVSEGQHKYLCYSSQWEDDIATNSVWTERFVPSGGYAGYDFYVPFLTELSPNGFTVGEGMWVRGAYADTSDESGMALQMAGQGRGYIQRTKTDSAPRGIESVRFSARIAQTVSPGEAARYNGTPSESAPYLDNYTFLTRAAFDLNANSNFTGNASLSLMAFYQSDTGCYEARWEQLDGQIEDETGRILGPTPRGQRLALYRWEYDREWIATELYAATNSATVHSWNDTVAPRAIPQAKVYPLTENANGLMPFYIGAYNDATKNETLIIAAVCIPGGANSARNIKGFPASAEMSYLGTQNDKGWLYLVFRDKDQQKRLTSGTYGVLASNCEGVFARPQYHKGIVSWESTEAKSKALGTTVYPGPSLSSSQKATFYNSSTARECVTDMMNGYWIAPKGRMEQISEVETGCCNGYCASVVTQTVDIYTATLGTSDWSDTPVASCALKGFGKPGVLQGVTNYLWSTDDASVQIRAGGTIRDVRTDVVVDNIQILQWRGQDWLGNNTTERSQAGRTNFVYTSGWITDGALQLSPRRTEDDYPCSLRVPLCDGQSDRGIGLGTIAIRYQNAQTNACLLVQVATNGVSTLNLGSLTTDPGTDGGYWTTITNWDFSVMTPEQRAGGVLECSPGLHGVVGTLRVIVDPTLRARVKDVTDPTAFGSVEITEALFRDEPALNKGCWWGFNIRTIGDVSDAEQRMYLPDNPMRSPNVPPLLMEIGRSLALNNSITEDCDPEELAKTPNPYAEHMPFLQTPTFASNVVGEVSFRARKYALLKGAQCAEVTLYGTTALNVDALRDRDWEILNVFIISNTTYETYRFKADASKSYRAFRFAVTGVDGVKYPGPEPVCGVDPVRVLLDDVLVSESVHARMAFRNVGAFRHYISQTTHVPNVPSVSEQPICDEGWGVQAEIYPSMLGEEIDTTVKPRVRLHYYKGGLSKDKWGYSQWKDEAKGGWLTRATDTNNVYRSSATDSPATVIPMSSSTEVVQYMLEVVYTIINPDTGGRSVATNWLESVDWQTPSWYYPKDYNAEFGGDSADKFAAFSIIDKIAPGWAWINEINLFGAFSSSFRNSDKNRQFVEVVKPVDYDLNGWTLRMLAQKSYGSTQTAFLTNDVAIFGRNGVPKQKAGTAKCNYMSFIVVGNPTTEWTGTQYDGPWSFSTTDNRVFNAGGELGAYYPVAIQLVRPSGVIEHEVSILGTNAYESVATSIAWQYTSTNMVRVLKANEANSTVFALPDDCTSTATSVGVYGEDAARSKSALCWNNTMKLTPGEINEGQEISPDFPRPGGELVMVFAYVDSVLGHIRQTVGSGTNTTEMVTVTLPRSSEGGLNIKYNVDPWYELGTITETEGKTSRVPVIVATNAVREYTVNVAKGATENVTVVASAMVESRLRQYGLDERNRYTPAVLHWLENHKDAYGNDFYGWRGAETNDTIYLAEFLALSGNVITNMTLTQMYWLDMDPTASNMFFKAGMVRPPSQIVIDQPTYDPQSDPMAYTNLRMGVYMSISNGNGRVTHGGKSVWAPYVLRGLGKGELSWNYSPSTASVGAWTSETFKVTGFLNTGLSSTKDVDAWIPLRYFVFKEDSFDANFESEIDVEDPFSTRSPAYSEGWSRYVKEHGGVKPPVYMSWNIDERLKPITAEILAPTNRLVVTP